MADVARFSIGYCLQNDWLLRSYEPNTSEYTYVATCISIAQEMLEHRETREHLTRLALKFDDTALDGRSFRQDHQLARQWVDYFISHLRAKFPPVVVDFNITSQDCLGYQSKLPWEGELAEYRFNHGIHLNGSRVRDMVAAGADTSTEGGQRFRTFIFIFVITLIHEGGAHLLITWLGNGRQLTPPDLTAPGFGNKGVGEAGRYLEVELFGGTMEFYRDPGQGDQQTGIPYQLDEQGQAWRIQPDFINQVCRRQFTFPFPRVGNPVNRLTMVSLGRQLQFPPLNQRDRALMAHQADCAAGLSTVTEYRVSRTHISLVPSNPSIRLVKA